jgi:hypothetical protein
MALADTSYNLAAACDALANAITQTRNAKGYLETAGEGATLDHLTSSLRDEADQMRTAGVAASLESANAPLADINDAIVQTKQAVANLQTANAMITFAGSLLSLAAATATGDLGGIASSAGAVISEVRQL